MNQPVGGQYCVSVLEVFWKKLGDVLFYSEEHFSDLY